MCIFKETQHVASKFSIVGSMVGGRWVGCRLVGGALASRLVVDCRWSVGRWSTCRWVGYRWVGGLVEDLSVGWWSVVGGRWRVGGWWFCNRPLKSPSIILFSFPSFLFST